MFHRVDEHVACLLYGPLSLLWTEMPSGVGVCFWLINIMQMSFCLLLTATFYILFFLFFLLFFLLAHLANLGVWQAHTHERKCGFTCAHACTHNGSVADMLDQSLIEFHASETLNPVIEREGWSEGCVVLAYLHYMCLNPCLCINRMCFRVQLSVQ